MGNAPQAIVMKTNGKCSVRMIGPPRSRTGRSRAPEGRRHDEDRDDEGGGWCRASSSSTGSRGAQQHPDRGARHRGDETVGRHRDRDLRARAGRSAPGRALPDPPPRRSPPRGVNATRSPTPTGGRPCSIDTCRADEEMHRDRGRDREGPPRRIGESALTTASPRPARCDDDHARIATAAVIPATRADFRPRDSASDFPFRRTCPTRITKFRGPAKTT